MVLLHNAGADYTPGLQSNPSFASVDRRYQSLHRCGHCWRPPGGGHLAQMNDVPEEQAQLRAYVLEDDPDIAALEADLLRDMGFGVVTCTRIVELGDLIDVALPHLMVIDVMLPDGDGGDITEMLRTAWPGIPVVIVSAASRERLSELEGLGPVVPKPFNIEAFREAVETALEGTQELRSAS